MSIGTNKGEASFDNRCDGKGVQEFWTFTCPHCNVVRYVNPASGNIVRIQLITKMPENVVVDMAWRELDPPIACRKCMNYLCDNPICHLDCLPVDKGIDLAVSKGKDVSPFNTDKRSRFFLKEEYDKTKIYQGVSLIEGVK